MSNPRITPPPPERMPKATKDRIRAELCAAARWGRGGELPRRARWVAPVLAAAAVLAVVGGVFAVRANDQSSGDLHPAGGSSPATPLSTSRSSGSSHFTPVTPPTVPPGFGPAPPRGSRHYAANSRTYALRERLVQRPDGSIESDSFFAGGRAAEAVRSITYTFPDGHDVAVAIGHHGVWSVSYSPTTGQLLDGTLNRIQLLDPPWVAVTYTNGYVDRIPLRWPAPSCRLSGMPRHDC